MSRTSGSLAIAFGVLIAGGSALLSLVVAGIGLSYDGLTTDMVKEGAISIGLFGGIPFLFGIALILLGRRAIKAAKNDIVDAGEAARFGLPIDQNRPQQ